MKKRSYMQEVMRGLKPEQRDEIRRIATQFHISEGDYAWLFLALSVFCYHENTKVEKYKWIALTVFSVLILVVIVAYFSYIAGAISSPAK